MNIPENENNNFWSAGYGEIYKKNKIHYYCLRKKIGRIL